MLLCDLKPGEFGKILYVNPLSPLYKRLLELGFTAGADIECLIKAGLGDPIAYLICGRSLALRKTDSRFINIERVV